MMSKKRIDHSIAQSGIAFGRGSKALSGEGGRLYPKAGVELGKSGSVGFEWA